MTHVATGGFVAVRVGPTTGFSPSHTEMALDVSAVLTDLLAPAALLITVDKALVALSGHSLGGKIAVMAANADIRIDAVYALDPVNSSGGTAGQPNILPAGISQQTIPFGFAGELLDGSSYVNDPDLRKIQKALVIGQFPKAGREEFANATCIRDAAHGGDRFHCTIETRFRSRAGPDRSIG